MPQGFSLPTYSAIYAFGDSLSDAGNVAVASSVTGSAFPVSPPYFRQSYGSISGNTFSNGQTWVQNLSLSLGLGTLAPSFAGGTDFAFGGGETGPTPQNASSPGLQAISLPAQLTAFQTRFDTPSDNALYTVSAGSNDLLDILNASGLTAQQQISYVNAAVGNEISFINDLVGEGATDIVVLNVPDLGKTPGITSRPAAVASQASLLSSVYNASLVTQLASIEAVRIRVVDAYGLLGDATANPAAYGLTNATTPVWSGNYTSGSSGALAETNLALQNQFLFWDQLHPTETGHQTLANAAVEQLSGTPVLLVDNTTTNQPVQPVSQPYTGPVGDLQQQYINITPDNLNIFATTPNWFIHSGAGTDAISVSSGTNVLDGGTGSNFLTGGAGADTFFIDDRQPTSEIWSTINNFGAGDAATIFGITQDGFNLAWVDGEGAAGSTGLTLHATSPGAPTASVTFAGFTTADLSNGRLGVVYGTSTEASGAQGSPYLYVQANA